MPLSLTESSTVFSLASVETIIRGTRSAGINFKALPNKFEITCVNAGSCPITAASGCRTSIAWLTSFNDGYCSTMSVTSRFKSTGWIDCCSPPSRLYVRIS